MDLTDKQWEIIKKQIPRHAIRKDHKGRPWCDDRADIPLAQLAIVDSRNGIEVGFLRKFGAVSSGFSMTREDWIGLNHLSTAALLPLKKGALRW